MIPTVITTLSGWQALKAVSTAADEVEAGYHGDGAVALPDPGSLTVAQLQVGAAVVWTIKLYPRARANRAGWGAH